MTTIVCFPIHRQRSEIMRCAGNLDRLNGEAASRYWREEMRRLAARLSAIGMCGPRYRSRLCSSPVPLWRRCSAPMPSARLQQNDSK